MQDYYRIADALGYIKENREKQPSLEEIAAAVHISPFHFQRMFTDWAGVSPKKFLHYISVEYAKEILKKDGASVYDAAYETGLSSTGRLHDLFVNIEGMTPGEYKHSGKGLVIRYSLQNGLFGNYLVASTETGICNVLFYEDKPDEVEAELNQLWSNAIVIKEEDSFHKLVNSFFGNGLSIQNPLTLHLKGTPFQLKVWEALLKIPEGSLQSYSHIASGIAQPTAQRAVGTAIGQNPVGFIIPCHRVIKTVGGIGEYRWGTARKMAMIGWEAAQHVPQTP
ncbi:bifunctional transcriptional activator/DNA repair enzyme AdaA [Parasediminibacterium sp. JCM 36343]|uniref:bifunctional transcriptional activator/DNA repair enzyme AdaA n=1 Tax=Parasediminibacterium sp. JCM 36343 TaxID=3374279 RepID=UPI00397E6675